MDTVPLSAQVVLREYFSDAPHLRHPSLRGRAPRVQTLVERHLETHGTEHLTHQELVLLAAERQLEPHGAVARTMGLPSMLATLPGLLEPPSWPSDVREASARLHLLTGLRGWILQVQPSVVRDPAFARFSDALRDAHARLRADRRRASSRTC